MSPVELSNVQQARTAHASAQAAVDAARARVTAAAAGSDAYAQATRTLGAAQATLASARNTLNQTIGQQLSTNNPPGDVQRLDADHPIVLFPVRVETRFSSAQSALLIRVYPDEILANSFEPELTADELACGQLYWTEAAGTVGPNNAWRHLLGTYPSPRAAWIVLQTNPANPAPPLRATSWTKPAVAPLLPDRWIAVAYRGGAEIARAWSSPVLEPLPLTIAPDTPAASLVDISGALNLGVDYDPAVLWTVDYPTAVAAGMAFALPLQSADFTAGIDRLLVLGVKTTIAPADAATAIRSLIDGHHYTRGIAFVPQGTPTHDSREVPSGYPPPDPNGAISFAVEEGPGLATPDGDGVLWSRALGLADDTVAHIAGADRTEQASAAAMNRALFPATWEYFLETMMAPIVSEGTIDATREYFANRVRARGHFPNFRIGNVPYGLLPVSSLALWKAIPTRQPGASPITSVLPGILRAAQPFWSAQIGAAPHLGRTNDGEGDVLDALSMDASARTLRFRRLLGAETLANLVGLLGVDWALVTLFGDMTAANLLRSMGWSGANPRALTNVFAANALPFRFPFVATTLSETDPLAPNFITWVRTASIDDLRAGATPFPAPSVLLFRLLSYAALTESWREGRRILLAAGAAVDDLAVRELTGIVAGTETRPTPWDYLGAPVSSVTHALTLAHFLSPIQPGEATRTLPPAIVAYREALGVLETLPTAELDRFCTETLDLASNRIDAWTSALYAERLDTMRSTTPTGSHVGAYAWVESLKPGGQPAIRLSDRRAALDSTGGYIQAPSMAHAAAAAVLRNAYLSYAGDSGANPYAVDLSSARVRAARFVLEAVAEGQQVGAVFGYQIESGLHARLADALIDPLRNVYPLVANKAFDSGEQAEAIAARNVVDGLALRTAWKANAIPWGTAGLPAAASGALYDALIAELGALDTTVDSVANVLLADSVYQLVQGSTAGASASLDTMAQGARPPDPGVVHPVTGGVNVTHRVAIVIGDPAVAISTGWPSTATPRAAAEPRLDAWVGSLLGDPGNVRCIVRVTDNSGASPVVTDHTVTMDQLGLRPIDMLALAASVTDQPAASELDRRCITAALGDTPVSGTISVIYARDPGWDRDTVRAVPELLQAAQALLRLIGGARTMAWQDLVRAADVSTTTLGVLAVADAEARATAAEAGLAAIKTQLDAAVAPGATRAALVAALRATAAYGVTGAYPVPGAGANEGDVATTLIDQAQRTQAAVNARIAAATAAHLPPTPPPTDAARVAAAVEIAQQIFGQGFVLVTGFAPSPAATVGSALAAGPALVGDPHAPIKWLQQASRVRTALGRWRRVRLLTEAMGAPPVALDIAQFPVVAGAPPPHWVGLPFASEADRVSGRLSVALARPSTPAATATWYGLTIDEWVELIPNATEMTGLAFHYDVAKAEAPHAVLVAVPPASVEQWDFNTLATIVGETLDLAKMRGVDGRLLGSLSQLIPAIYFTANANDDTVTFPWRGTLRAETTITAATIAAGATG